MDLDLIEEKINKIEEELERYKHDELQKVTKIKSEIKLFDLAIKRLNTKKCRERFENVYKSLEKQKKEKFNEKNIYTKNGKDIFTEIKFLKQKEKSYNFINRPIKLKYNITDVANEIKETLNIFNIQRKHLFKYIFEKISKSKNKSLDDYNKYLHLQKEIDILLASINKNALMEIFVFTKNLQFFQNSIINMFNQFNHQIENTITDKPIYENDSYNK
ncbi:conserved Plasmodium protein, unknown function [Plasmodium yoelii]|uniref:Uncharacterized protein n=2 Tax=Plasmodium yoelii TaxID=5861 RepID=A0AAE9WPS4_PLAYO|nr:conserved Plasmodium protein, unknown function [Plasmodium yoelii]WBY58023.1 hypothetical protein Py17XNL_001002300 [Plasmodium yoelii yoelii]CDU85091.1 conserved Plasmodium protein, unknown function [Plasmodium yoelii]VTZ78986.1 conserved Plasmodium protein, unknown function [Plasmodium yoelii]|eukprot:XP_022813339.1 conserved Plasmodium protein, unknown function [Plasmodium yoelii]